MPVNDEAHSPVNTKSEEKFMTFKHHLITFPVFNALET